ncbi:hypothetical protein [Caproicibacter fermentans]|uniref:Uncharacterized protein n=1 Tax=Caproicibacter fermentans TaxID=2576756 RepID=A0A7G8TD43_9FIRM|nr:hypothetical protein [Caproicibacter fermentans]QNK41534.1 hypothetical protein HCR03_04530 [Caproicibacter fermentans]
MIIIKGILSALLTFVLSITIITIVLPAFFNKSAKDYQDSIGITSSTEGTVSSKEFTAAHSENSWFLFSYSSKYYPDEWQIEIRKYDSSAKKWETATIDVDKTTFNEVKVGDYYQAPAHQTAFFIYDR